ncbi:MAG: RNA methyltransferase [Chitinophagaceae bacterium]
MQLPQTLMQSLNGVAGFMPEAFLAAHTLEAPVSVRVNPNKSYDLSHLLLNQRVPWSAQGFYLKERPSFTLDPGIHGGAYYVQEASSMFLEFALQQVLHDQQGLYALDLCAAPGGKATLLSSMPQFSLVLANEIIRTRVTILHENAVKWGEPKLLVSNNDPSAFNKLDGFFDVMVVDAPCSGSGLFRKDPSALDEWSVQNVQLCAARQQRILSDALPALKDGGVLVYSTCSYSPEEDEEILQWLVGEHGLTAIDLQVPQDWGIVKTASANGGIGYRFFPDKLKGEGFFISCLQKTGGGKSGIRTASRYEKSIKSASYHQGLKTWVDEGLEIRVRSRDNELILIPAALEPAMQELEQVLHLRKSGVRAGALMRDQFIPDHELVLSQYLSRSAPRIELTREEALCFLRKQDINPQGSSKGWFTVTHGGLPIGLIKHLGNRVNNYYPSSWRILMS